MFSKKTVTILLLFISLNSRADSGFSKKLDQFFNQMEKHEKGMGSVVILKGKNVVYERAFGYQSLEKKIPNLPATIFHIGSLSKTYTATIILKLIENKLLSLDSRLKDYFSEIPNADKITIEQLLRHRSGIKNYTDADDYTKWMETKASHEELLKKIAKLGSAFEPDSKFEYSNSNYFILTLIAEKVSGKNYSELLEVFITKKLRLQNTAFFEKAHPKA
jgi:CubicO group peptidase (beta-lactamase class C family)